MMMTHAYLMKEDEYLDDDFASDGIYTPSDGMYSVHNTIFRRTPHAKSLIPRKPNGKFKPHKSIPPKPRYNGPVYLPKHIYNMLSEDIKKELDKYNQDKKAKYMPNHSRMAKVHEEEHEEVDDGPDHPESDLENHFHEESYPMQDSEIRTFWKIIHLILYISKHSASDRILSTTPGAEPPRDAKDSGSARSHSTHLETSSSNRP